jgi:hypothetical protein
MLMQCGGSSVVLVYLLNLVRNVDSSDMAGLKPHPIQDYSED